MRQITDLYDYQTDASKFAAGLYGANLYCPVGSGKTATVLTLIADEQPDKQAPALIVAPLRVVQTVWEDEASRWEHLKDLTFSKVIGTAKQREQALMTTADVYLINYENLGWLAHQPCWNNSCWDMIVWDEVSKMGGRGVRWNAVKKVARSIQHRIALTGTPRGNSLLNIWGQCHLVDDQDLLGRSYTAFKKRWFYPTDYKQYNWVPLPGAEEEIMAIISQFSYTIPEEMIHNRPAVIENRILVPLETSVTRKYIEFEKKLILELELNKKELAERAALMAAEDPEAAAAMDKVVAKSAGVLVNKLRQFAAGRVYDGQTEKRAREIHDAKFDAFDDLVEEMQGEPLLVFYEFLYQFTEIRRRWPQAADLTEEHVALWNTGKLPLLVMHPLAGAHGLNLQHGGHNICFLSEPWSADQKQQSIGRLDRTGQKNPVTVHRLESMGTIDMEVHAALEHHVSQQQYIMKLVAEHTT